MLHDQKHPFKVTLTTRHFKPLGGLEKTAWHLAKAFASKGADVDILTSDSAATKQLSSSIHLHTLPINQWLNFRKMNAFDRLCHAWHQKQNASIIFGLDRTRFQTHLRAGNGVHAAYLEQRKRIEKHFTYFKKACNRLNHTILDIEKSAFESPALHTLFTNSYMVKREILSHYKTPPDKIEVIHNGVEWHDMEQDFNAWHLKKEETCLSLGLDPDQYHFLFIGNGYQRKGLAFLLQALTRLKSDDFHVSVIGHDKNIKGWKRCAHQLNMQNRVTFFGPLNHLRPFYQYSDCLVIPSIYDPFANVTVEALAMGLYVVSSQYNGGCEILTKNGGSIISQLDDPDSLAEALQQAIAHPKTYQQAQTIRQQVKHLDFSNQLKKFVSKTLSSIS